MNMKLGTRVTVVRNGGRKTGLISGHCRDGRLVVKYDDGSRGQPLLRDVRLLTRPPTPEEDAVFKADIRRVFAEFASELGRPPTAAELLGWLPGSRAVELAAEIGLEVTRVAASGHRGIPA